MPPRVATHDPLRTFKFRVRLGERTIAGVVRVSALGRSVAPREIREGGDLLSPRQQPGAVTFEEVTLEWGLSVDKTLEQWANAVTRMHNDPADAAARGFKRTLFIDVYDLHMNPLSRADKPAVSYKLHRCWISRYTALPALDAEGSAVGVQSVTLRHEGWERVT